MMSLGKSLFWLTVSTVILFAIIIALIFMGEPTDSQLSIVTLLISLMMMFVSSLNFINVLHPPSPYLFFLCKLRIVFRMWWYWTGTGLLTIFGIGFFRGLSRINLSNTTFDCHFHGWPIAGASLLLFILVASRWLYHKLKKI